MVGRLAARGRCARACGNEKSRKEDEDEDEERLRRREEVGTPRAEGEETIALRRPNSVAHGGQEVRARRATYAREIEHPISFRLMRAFHEIPLPWLCTVTCPGAQLGESLSVGSAACGQLRVDRGLFCFSDWGFASWMAIRIRSECLRFCMRWLDLP